MGSVQSIHPDSVITGWLNTCLFCSTYDIAPVVGHQRLDVLCCIYAHVVHAFCKAVLCLGHKAYKLSSASSTDHEITNHVCFHHATTMWYGYVCFIGKLNKMQHNQWSKTCSCKPSLMLHIISKGQLWYNGIRCNIKVNYFGSPTSLFKPTPATQTFVQQ